MEAMSCGIPVICAKFTSSLKPIFQNSVLLVERDTNKIIEKLTWFLNTFDIDNVDNKCYLILDNRCRIY